ncbi:MAG: SPASM domain-containing protein [Thermoplasmatales archaeon]|nr:MAG: SPASM domain-containing protein [Thermoplasmatales archaeon]
MSPNTTSTAGFSSIIQYSVFLRRIFEYNVKRRVLPFPSIFCIQTINLCNGSCIMCPLVQNSKKESMVMSNRLFEKIIKEISQEQLKFTYINLFLQNEPLMDKDIFKKIGLIKKISGGKIKTGLVTNGTIFSNEKIKELEKSKIDEIIFSLDALTEETYTKIRPGLNFKDVLKNIENVIDSGYDKYLAVKFVLQKDNILEFDDFKKFWKKKGIPIQISYLNNRSGDLNTYDDLCLKKRDFPILVNLTNYIGRKMFRGCSTPLITFNILYNGDVILCCDDYSKKMILGNVNDSSIKEIWNSKKYQKIREILYSREYKKIPVCCTCSKVTS